MKAIIIGSGFGGLALAIRLQARGFEVALFEKNGNTGGHATPLERDGYCFDMGPSLITANEILERIFAAAGRRLSDVVDLVPLDPYYRIYFHDKSYIDYNGDGEGMKRQMAQFSPRDAGRYDRYMAASRRIYDAVITEGLGSTPFTSLKTMAAFVPRALKLGAVLPSYTFVSRYFRDPRHRFTYSFHPLFIGGNPFRAPAVYQMIPYLEKEMGVWYTRGGMNSLVAALETAFRDLGGEVRLNAEVEQIVIEDGTACGVRSAGELHRADLVVSNADYVHTITDLIEPQTKRRPRNYDYSMSAFLLYLGLSRKYSQLLHHTLILSPRYRGLIRDIFDRRVLPDDFSLYLHTPTRTDPSMAPPECESLTVLAPVANLGADINWEEMADPFSERLLAFLEDDFGLDDLRASIQVKIPFTPLDFRSKANAHLGSAWGVEPRLTQTGYFRPHNRSRDIKGLYFVGTSTHPGAGLPGVMLSAETTERVILDDTGKS